MMGGGLMNNIKKDVFLGADVYVLAMSHACRRACDELFRLVVWKWKF